MICTNCGTPNREGEYICRSCGKLLVAVGVTKRIKATSGLLVQNPRRQTTDRLQTVSVKLASKEIEFPVRSGTEIVVGRGLEAAEGQHVLDVTDSGGTEKGVSRRHAVIRIEGFSAYLIDLSSTNGTFLNGRRIHPDHRHLLYSQDIVRCGVLEIQIMLA